MNFRFLSGATILVAILFAPTSKGQTAPPDSDEKAAAFAVKRKDTDFKTTVSEPIRKSEFFFGNPKSPLGFNKKRFILLSAAVYGASLADMHQTLRVWNYSWWYETDPLARPFVKLPAPAYYATGLALATGVNWLSWKMGHSQRWRKLAPIPQLLSIAGNTYGFRSNRLSNY